MPTHPKFKVGDEVVITNVTQPANRHLIGVITTVIEMRGFYSGSYLYLTEASKHCPGTGLAEKHLLKVRKPQERIKLNESYSATIDHASRAVHVGCQTFTFDAVKRLYNAIELDEDA